MADRDKNRILVLGGGFAGMFAAKELQRRVGRVARGLPMCGGLVEPRGLRAQHLGEGRNEELSR